MPSIQLNDPHPFLRLAKPARVTARAPESPKPWSVDMLPAFVDKSGWVCRCDKEGLMELWRVVAVRQGVLPTPFMYHLVHIQTSDQGIGAAPGCCEDMVRRLNMFGFVPAEVNLNFREAVE